MAGTYEQERYDLTGRVINGAVCLIILFGASAPFQASTNEFVLDPTRPFLYLEFDHAGPSTHPAADEDSKRIWLSMVNNCKIPVRIEAIDLGLGNPGIGVSVVRHAEGRLWRARRARLTFSKMSAALAVQMNGFGFSL
jgi:hypothetical protein